jgi:hypothetical protein
MDAMDFRGNDHLADLPAAAPSRPIKHLEPDDMSAYDTDSPDSVDWLPAVLKEHVAQFWPEAGCINDGGNADCNKLARAAHLLFKDQLHFCNFYQLKQFTQLFASK